MLFINKKNMEEIVQDILKNKWIYNICKRYCQNDRMLSEDLAHEVMLSILEKPNEKLIECYSTGNHKKYIVTMIKNNYLSSSSPFFKKYRKNIGLDLEVFINYEDGNE